MVHGSRLPYPELNLATPRQDMRLLIAGGFGSGEEGDTRFVDSAELLAATYHKETVNTSASLNMISHHTRPSRTQGLRRELMVVLVPSIRSTRAGSHCRVELKLPQCSAQDCMC